MYPRFHNQAVKPKLATTCPVDHDRYKTIKLQPQTDANKTK